MSFLAAILIVTNIGYTAAFDTDRRCTSWVAYDLEPANVVRMPRVPFDFTPDPRIPDTDLSEDYRRSGYDRGHMAPAADFNWNTNALVETYYFSNICPQVPAVNRGKWLDAEKDVRSLAASGTVHVVTFPYRYTSGRKIGNVSVPDYLVKVVYGYFGVRMYIIKNQQPTDERKK